MLTFASSFVSIVLACDTQVLARVAQLVEHDLAKVGAAGSSPVSRSFYFKSRSVI